MAALGSYSGRTRVALGSHLGKGVLGFAENIFMNPVVEVRLRPRGIRPTSRKRRPTYPQGTPHGPQAGSHTLQ
jgi:hypothetical protein